MKGFTTGDWHRLLGRDLVPGTEQVVVIGKASKVFRVTKGRWTQLFSGWNGMTFRKGAEIELVKAGSGGPRAELPAWLRAQLSLGTGSYLGITRRDEKYYVKKLVPQRTPSDVPGCIVYDEFTDGIVTRKYSLLTDPADITAERIDSLMSGMARLKHDPVAPLSDRADWLGLVARKELSGGWSRTDEAVAADMREDLSLSQLANGSWQDSSAATAFTLIRLLELGATRKSRSVSRGIDWLLSSSGPSGFPGFFMVSEDAATRFNEWKAAHSGTDRYSANPRKNEEQIFAENREAGGNTACELRVASATATSLEALLRYGLTDHPRVRRAINTFLALRGARWCACGWFVARAGCDLDSRSDPDFNVPPSVGTGATKVMGWPVMHDVFHWPADEATVLKMMCTGSVERGGHKIYRGYRAGKRRTSVLRESDSGSGNCAFDISRGLSWHPSFSGSSLEVVAAVECEGRQSWDGSWGTNSLAMVYSNIERFACPLSRFLLARSIPFLVRHQQSTGLWEDVATRSDHRASPEYVTFTILRALKKHKLLETVLP